MAASASAINLNPAAREISGWSIGGHFCNTKEVRQIFFYAVFDSPFKAWSTWSDKMLTPGATNGAGTASGAFVTFKPAHGRSVLAKVGISYVSIENAKANVRAENPVKAFKSRDFDRAVQSASDIWNAWLNRIQVSGGTQAEKETFYSMLYHALLGPIIVSDANGEYFGYDGQVTRDGKWPGAIRRLFRLGHLPQRMPVAGHDRPQGGRRHGAVVAGGLPAGRRVSALGRDDARTAG